MRTFRFLLAAVAVIAAGLVTAAAVQATSQTKTGAGMQVTATVSPDRVWHGDVISASVLVRNTSEATLHARVTATVTGPGVSYSAHWDFTADPGHGQVFGAEHRVPSWAQHGRYTLSVHALNVTSQLAVDASAHACLKGDG